MLLDRAIVAGVLRDDGVLLRETEVSRVEAVGFVDLGDTIVAWLGKDDIDALPQVND